MQPAIHAGYYRWQTRLILRFNGDFDTGWWVRYNHPDLMVDFPPSVSVSLGGRVLASSISELKLEQETVEHPGGR